MLPGADLCKPSRELFQTEFLTVGNGQEFCIRGRYLEVEVVWRARRVE